MQHTMKADDADISEERQRKLAFGILKQATQRELAAGAKLVGQWQRGIETMAGQAQWKLRLTLAHSPSPARATVNHYIRP
jgi:hypothetical protein